MQLYIMMGILLHLLSKGKTTAKNLSQKFEVSPRSIYRYIDSLSINGVPVICASGRNGGIYIDPNYTLSNLYFTKQELNFLSNTLSLIPLQNTCLTEKINYLLQN